MRRKVPCLHSAAELNVLLACVVGDADNMFDFLSDLRGRRADPGAQHAF